jgi:hypothetical protein
MGYGITNCHLQLEIQLTPTNRSLSYHATGFGGDYVFYATLEVTNCNLFIFKIISKVLKVSGVLIRISSFFQFRNPTSSIRVPQKNLKYHY